MVSKQSAFGGVQIAAKLGGFAQRLGAKKMDFPSKRWVFPVDIERRCAIMMELFEAGNTSVLAGFSHKF